MASERKEVPVVHCESIGRWACVHDFCASPFATWPDSVVSGVNVITKNNSGQDAAAAAAGNTTKEKKTHRHASSS